MVAAWVAALFCQLAASSASSLSGEVPSGKALLYKDFGTECGQVLLDAGLADWAVNLGGLKDGSCAAAMGFSEETGTQEVDLPVVGKLRMALFRKPNVLDLAMTVGSQLQGKPASQSNACCHVCKHGEHKYYNLEKSRGQCREVCLSGAKKMLLSFSGILDGSFQFAQPGQGCAQMGFEAYNATLTKGLEPAGLTWDLYRPRPLGEETLHKVSAGLCGQVTLAENQILASTVPEAKELLETLGFEKGDCVVAGYTVDAGSTQQLPQLGLLHLFRKEGELNLLDGFRLAFDALTQDVVPLHRFMGGDLCGEARVDRKLENAVVKVGGFKAGSCQDQGYKYSAGSQTLDVPLLTSVQLALYRKTDLAKGVHI
jgi:hypothetical protein